MTDLADAMSFYEGLLGWRYRQLADDGLQDLVMIESGGTLIGSFRRSRSLPSGDASPILYFTVHNLNDSVQRARDLGARLEGPRVELGRDRGRYQWLRDRSGHRIGLWADA